MPRLAFLFCHPYHIRSLDEYHKNRMKVETSIYARSIPANNVIMGTAELGQDKLGEWNSSRSRSAPKSEIWLWHRGHGF